MFINGMDKIETVVYCDMDGVLVDFDEYYKETFGLYPHQCSSSNAMWHRINQYRTILANQGFKADWFDGIKPKSDAIELWIHLRRYNTAILTATGEDHHNAIREKTEWFNKHLKHINNAHLFFVRSGVDKAVFANPYSILIDDRQKVIDAWEKAGGIGILHKSASDTIEQLMNIPIIPHANWKGNE